MTTQDSKKRRKRPDIVKTMEIAFALFLVLCIAVVLAGFVPISHPRLTRKVSTYLNQGKFDSCSIAKVTVALWSGCTLHGVSIAGRIDQDRRYRFSAPVFKVRANLLMVGLHYGTIRRRIADELRDESVKSPIGPANRAQKIVRLLTISSDIKGAVIEKADLIIIKKGLPLLRGDGVTGDISFPEPGSQGISGSFSAARIAASGIDVLKQASGDFTYAKGILTIDRCKARSFDGKIKLDARLDLGKKILQKATFSAGRVDLGKIPIGAGTAGRLTGSADLKFTLDSSALKVDSLHGKGTLSAAPCTITGFPFQRSLATMLVYPGLKALSFRKLKADVRLKEHLVFETRADGEGDTLSVKADGWIRADGKVNESLVCTLAKAGVSTLPDLAARSLEDAPGGAKILRCRVYGWIQNPQVSVDRKVIEKAVKNMFEEVKNNWQKWIK